MNQWISSEKNLIDIIEIHLRLSRISIECLWQSFNIRKLNYEWWKKGYHENFYILRRVAIDLIIIFNEKKVTI